MRNINVVAKKMARNGLKIANSLGCAFRFESDFSTVAKKCGDFFCQINDNQFDTLQPAG